MSETKAILLCGSRIALPVLRDLVFHQQLAAVIIPKHCTAFAEEVQQLLHNSGVPVLLVQKNNFTSIIQQAIGDHAPALGLVFTFTYKIPAVIYNLTPKGFFNIHPGPLPAYRGPDPIFQQVKNREPYGGVSIHQLDEGLDTGPLVMNNKVHLSVTDTYGILTKKLSELAAGMVSTLMKMADFGTTIPSRTQDNSKAVFYQRQTAADIIINWKTMYADDIVALVNACNPWNKGAVTKLNNNVIRLLGAHGAGLQAGQKNEPGTILSIEENGMKVATTAGGAIVITIIYTDEGFLMASRLKDLGVVVGASFDP